MIKNDITKSLTSKLKLDAKTATNLTENIIKAFKDSLITDGKLVLAGFGKFKVREKAKRIGRNPKTKEEHEISARKTISFYPSQLFKKYLNTKNDK